MERGGVFQELAKTCWWKIIGYVFLSVSCGLAGVENGYMGSVGHEVGVVGI